MPKRVLSTYQYFLLNVCSESLALVKCVTDKFYKFYRFVSFFVLECLAPPPLLSHFLVRPFGLRRGVGGDILGHKQYFCPPVNMIVETSDVYLYKCAILVSFIIVSDLNVCTELYIVYQYTLIKADD